MGIEDLIFKIILPFDLALRLFSDKNARTSRERRYCVGFLLAVREAYDCRRKYEKAYERAIHEKTLEGFDELIKKSKEYLILAEKQEAIIEAMIAMGESGDGPDYRRLYPFDYLRKRDGRNKRETD